MVRPPFTRIALLVAAACIVLEPTNAASPRAPLETLVEHPPPASTMDMGDWLRLLVGRFKWDGVLDTQPQDSTELNTDLLSVQGMSDCVSVGAGPGVQCVIDVRWPENYSFEGNPVAVPNLTPAMSMFGIDAARQRLVYLQVDNKGLSIGGPGTLSGNGATMRAPCIGTDLPLQAPATPGESPFASSDAGFTGGDASGSDSSGGADGGGQSPGGGLMLSGGQGAGTGPAGAARYTSPISSISAEPGPWLGCIWITRIDAKPGRDLIFINILYGDRADPTNTFAISLRRMKNAADQGSAARDIASFTGP